jgi:hypothetical protein
VQLYNDGNPEGAVAEFERAYKLAPTYRLLYNIGVIRMQLHDYSEAMKAFQAYLAGGGSDIAPARRTEVEKNLSGLRSRVGTVLVSSNAMGAEVSVDDVVFGRVPLAEPLVLNPGQRRITISAGASSRSRVISVVGQEIVNLELNLESARSATPAAPLFVERSTSPSRTPAYVLWSVTGALGVAAAVAGALSLSAMRDLDSERNGSTTRTRLDAAASEMKTLSLTADILTGSALLAGGAALYFTLRRSPQESSQMVRAGVSATGVRLEGRF